MIQQGARASSRLRSIPAQVLVAVAAGVVGAIEASVVLGWQQINPSHVSWLRGDPAVYQAGWEFLRNGPWRFPPTWLPHLDYPFGISAAYLDVIPLVAVPLKLVSHVLPQHFQYLGLYALLCLVLQGYFGVKLMSCFTSDKLAILIGALFFLVSPILLMRFYGHFSLCSQWLIVAALYCYFRPPGDLPAGYLWRFAALLALSGGITPYFSVMVFAIAIAALGRLRLDEDSLGAMYLIFFATIFLICLGASLYVFGFVTPGSMPSMDGTGYGSYSLNLIGPFNPSGASLLFPTFRVFPLQSYEGYNYLGDGIILLAVLCLVLRPSFVMEFWRPMLRPLLIVSVLFFVLALSTVATFEQTVVANVPLPPRIVALLATFRSSARFFWPVHYLITLGAVVGSLYAIKSRFLARTVLVLALIMQFLYVLPIMHGVASESAQTVSTPLTARDWQMLGKTHSHLLIVPAWQCSRMATPGGTEAWPWFADLAATNRMTLNSVHAARQSAASQEYNCSGLLREIGLGKLQRDTAYVLLDPLAVSAIAHNRTHYCRRVDGFNLCSFDPADAQRSRFLAAELGARKK